MRFFDHMFASAANRPGIEARVGGSESGWFDGRVVEVDFENRKFLVAFDCAGWEDRWMDASEVRMATNSGASEAASFAVGDTVELRVGESLISGPAHWTLAKIRSIKNGFFFVASEGGGRETIVEAEALRSVSRMKPLSEEFGPQTQKSEISVASELHKWLSSHEAVGVFEDIRNKADALFVGRRGSVAGGFSSASGGFVVVVVGSPAAQRRAKLLLEVHLKHQRELQLLGERREQRKQREQELHTVEFEVERSLVGLVIGKNGENVRKIQSKHKVEVQIAPEGSSNHSNSNNSHAGNFRKVRISGERAEGVEAAREALEYVSEEFKISEGQAGWVLGKGGKNLRDVEEKCGLFRARFSDNRKSIELVGTRTAVEDAVALLESHLTYLDAFNQVRDENGGFFQNKKTPQTANTSKQQQQQPSSRSRTQQRA